MGMMLNNRVNVRGGMGCRWVAAHMGTVSNIFSRAQMLFVWELISVQSPGGLKSVRSNNREHGRHVSDALPSAAGFSHRLSFWPSSQQTC